MTTYDITQGAPAKIQEGDVLNCPYSGARQSVTLPPGVYKLECWGAEGGEAYTLFHDTGKTSISGGKGGYARGALTVPDLTEMFLYVGGMGATAVNPSNSTPGGFNGGGDGGGCSQLRWFGASGGGGSDVRLSASLYSRILVAGGGGGGSQPSPSYGHKGGAGGGLEGIKGGARQPNHSQSTPGTQTTAGSANDGTGKGAFGVGGSLSVSDASGGGGGGWYGGGASRSGYSLGEYYYSGGSGGSGYTYTAATARHYPAGCELSAQWYLSDIANIAGDQVIQEPNGAQATGHAGHGYARITVLSLKPETNLHAILGAQAVPIQWDGTAHFALEGQLMN